MARMPAHTRWILAAAALATLAAACSTAIVLTDEGKGVTKVTDADRPGGCRLIGDVAIGVPPDAARPHSEQELVILMRNKAGEMGGTHVIVDSKDQRNPESEEGSYWVGRGRAYNCPEEESAPAEDDTGLPAEETEGGEEAVDEEGAGGDVDEGEPAEEQEESPSGVSDDDLLDAI